MPKVNSFSRTLLSRSTFYRLIALCGLCFASYFFIYKVDMNATVALTYRLLVSITNFNRGTSPTIVVPLIPITDPTSTSTSTSTSSPKSDTPSTTIYSNLTNGSNNTSSNKTELEQPKEAFVTFSNNQPAYLAVLKVLLDSVHAFSTRPIIAFGIDVDLDIDTKQYPRVIKRRISQSDCGPVRFYQ